MADVVTSQTIQDGQRKAVMKFTNVSDGTGESAVKKVDVSALNANAAGVACSSVAIAKVWWATTGMSIKIDFDASTNVLAVSRLRDFLERSGLWALLLCLLYDSVHLLLAFRVGFILEGSS